MANVAEKVCRTSSRVLKSRFILDCRESRDSYIYKVLVLDAIRKEVKVDSSQNVEADDGLLCRKAKSV